ncbi:MAG: NAD-dependent epimerase/dehydratase family protein [Spirochaetes bacterium]|nr:NAD-dependent epimerase/dehydratase family protein [Spirochaetota bacterium]
MKVCVVGGSGFIGTRLCKRLERAGVEFFIVDKNKSMTYESLTRIVDVRDYKALENAVSGDVIVNLAAEHRDDVSPKNLYDEVNVGGARNICRAAEEKNISRIVFTSSVAVYGFAPIGTDESGSHDYFNDYGRTKDEAEKVYRQWLEKDPGNRTLVIVRPSVVFGERNRGNVYNLLKQISSRVFMMIGNGKNVKSMVYVENVAAFLEFSLVRGQGLHISNYIDKPDLDMNSLVSLVYKELGRKRTIRVRLPYFIGWMGGKVFDLAAIVMNRKLSISSIRIKKFCSNSSFSTNVGRTGFVAPVTLREGLERTIRYEFVEKNQGHLFFSE